VLRRALDAFARMDTAAADQIIRDDGAIDSEFRAFVRKLVTYMTKDPRAISTGLDCLFIAKAIERIGDHATNIAESVVYVVRGTNIRTSLSLPDTEQRGGLTLIRESRVPPSINGRTTPSSTYSTVPHEG
jgi:phosphate uptake regulator